MAPMNVMDPAPSVDPVEEIRLRVWARQHYVPQEQRSDLHPVILDEMRRRDEELAE
ncbi:MAG: hypothetical protein KDA58_05210 [Planctomycetaceae bacterium]|nr:hypothetical protein [Planctomycetaceae bacterium]